MYEWCRDWYGPYPSGPATNPLQTNQNLSDKPRRVLRGGSWLKDGRHCRSAARYRNTPGSRNADNGFRIVAGLEEQKVSRQATPVLPPRSTEPLRGEPLRTDPPIDPERERRAAVARGDANEPGMEVLSTVVGCLCMLVVPAGIVYAVVRSMRSRSGVSVTTATAAAAYRTRAAADGFYLDTTQIPHGAPIEYRCRVNGAPQTGSTTSEATREQFIYTGGRPDAIVITTVGRGGGHAPDDVHDDFHWRDRHRDDSRSDRNRASSGSTFSGYPSAY
jgi:formylglycine-generating enzyme